jgi:hypothetical protein
MTRRRIASESYEIKFGMANPKATIHKALSQLVSDVPAADLFSIQAANLFNVVNVHFGHV